MGEVLAQAERARCPPMPAANAAGEELAIEILHSWWAVDLLWRRVVSYWPVAPKSSPCQIHHKTRSDRRESAAPQDLLQRLVYFHFAVVADESPLPEPVHKEIDARTRSADHFRQDSVA